MKEEEKYLYELQRMKSSSKFDIRKAVRGWSWSNGPPTDDDH